MSLHALFDDGHWNRQVGFQIVHDWPSDIEVMPTLDVESALTHAVDSIADVGTVRIAEGSDWLDIAERTNYAQLRFLAYWHAIGAMLECAESEIPGRRSERVERRSGRS